jgi:hypothetical protein
MRKVRFWHVLITIAIFNFVVLTGEIPKGVPTVRADVTHTQRLIVDSYQSGDAQSDGACTQVEVTVGDLANNKTHRGIICFDLNSLHREEIGQIVSAELDLSGHTNESRLQGGNPFRDLGNFQVVVVDLVSFNACVYDRGQCLSAYSMAGAMVYNRFGPPLSPINVTDPFKNAYKWRKRWFCLRLQFARETDGDNTWDMAKFFKHSASVTVRYSPPPPPVTLESPPNDSIVHSISPGPALNWRGIPGVSSYWVQLSHSRDFPSATTSEVYTNSFVPGRRLEDGRTYYWRVKVAGGEWRAVDPIWSFTVRVVPDMPWITSPPHGSTTNNRRPTLVWNSVPYAASYVLELREGGMSGPLVFPRVYPTATSFTVPNELALNKRYVWIIKACNRNNECSGPAMGWFEVALPAPQVTPSIPKQPPTKLPVPAPIPPVRPPVK